MRDLAVAFRDRIISPVVVAISQGETPLLETALAGAALREGFAPCCRSNQAFSLYGLSSSLHRRVWDEYLAYRPELASLVRGFASQRQFLQNPDHELDTNINYATAITASLLQWQSDAMSGNLNPENLSRFWTYCVLGNARRDPELCQAYRKILRWFDTCSAAA